MSAAANRLRVAQGANGAGGKLRPEPRLPGTPPASRPVRRSLRPRRSGPSDLEVRQAAERLARTLGFELSELRAPGHRPALVDARALVTVALRMNLRASYPQAARALGRDHSTLVVALQRRGLA